MKAIVNLFKLFPVLGVVLTDLTKENRAYWIYQGIWFLAGTIAGVTLMN